MAKSSKIGQTAMWVLMGALVVGLSGFGVSNFGGSLRTVASVDGEDISTDDYFRNLRNELNTLSQQAGRGVSLTDAQAMGVDGAVLQQLMASSMMDAEVKRLGISVPDDLLAKEILAMPTFAGPDGFNRNRYRALLRDNGWTEAQFEERMRGDIARGLVQSAVAAGFAGSDTAAKAILGYIEERRSFSVLHLTDENLNAPVAPATEDELKAYYEANPEAFTRQEARKITYAALLADEVAKTLTIDEADLRKLYAERESEFRQPERRLVERLVFADEAAAAAAKARVDAGEVSFADLVRERGLDLTDADMGDVTEAALGEAGASVFAAETGAVVGPLTSNLGPALFSVNGVLPAEEISFEEAREALSSEFALDTARRAIQPQSEMIEDQLAGGASLEDLVRDVNGMTLATIELEPGQAEGVAAFPSFRTQAEKLAEGDFAEVITLEDGSLAVLRLDEILPPALRPFEDVRDQVVEAAQQAKVFEALKARLAEVQAGVAAGQDLADFGTVTQQADMPRAARVDLAPADLVSRVFAATEGALLAVTEPNYVALVRLDKVTQADLASEESAALQGVIANAMGQEIGQDAYQLFANGLEATADIRIDQAAINSVHSQMR